MIPNDRIMNNVLNKNKNIGNANQDENEVDDKSAGKKQLQSKNKIRDKKMEIASNKR